MNPRIEEYLDALRKHLGSLARDERDAVLAEVQDHLEAESGRLQADDPDLSDDVAAARAIEAFGPADEIGIAYGGNDNGGVRLINQETGEKVLEGIQVAGRVAGKVAIFGGRGIKGILKFAGIAALSILGVATVLAVAGLIFAGTVLTVFDEQISEYIPHPLYDAWDHYPEDSPATVTRNETFFLRADSKEFWIDMRLDANGGCAAITLLNPDGEVAYESGPVCDGDHSNRRLTLAGAGTWTIEYDYDDFWGSMHVESMYFEQA